MANVISSYNNDFRSNLLKIMELSKAKQELFILVHCERIIQAKTLMDVLHDIGYTWPMLNPLKELVKDHQLNLVLTYRTKYDFFNTATCYIVELNRKVVKMSNIFTERNNVIFKCEDIEKGDVDWGLLNG